MLEALKKKAELEQKTTILVAEDDEGLNHLIQKILIRNGYQTEKALSGADAIQSLTKDANKVLLLDYILPDMTGAQVINALRDKNIDVPLIVMTGHGDERIAVDIMKMGIRDYIIKETDFVDHLPGILERVIKEVATEKELAKTEEKLQQAAHRWQITFEGIDDAICILDKEMRITQCNNAMVKFLGKNKEEIIKSKCYELVHSTTEPITDCPLIRMRETKHKENMILQYKDRWLDIAAHPLIGEKGALTGAVHIITDITKRKKIEEVVFRSENNLRKAQEVAHIGSWVWYTSANEFEMSDELYKILGLKKEDGPPIFDIEAIMIHPDDREILRNNITKCLQEKRPYSLSYRIYRPDNGELRHLYVETEVEELPGSNELVIYGTVQDITDRKQAEEEKEKLQALLQQAHKMEAVGQLAGGIAHDFNNILGGIVGYTDVLEIKPKVTPEQMKYISKIKEAALKASDLTRNLLAFARRTRIEEILVDVHEILKLVIELLLHSIDRRISIKTKLNAKKHIIWGDYTLIENLFLNLGINARDAMSEGGELTFETETMDLDADKIPNEFFNVLPGEYLRVSVNDNGIGMDNQTLNHIFEPFFTTKRVGKGTGLGLASVYGSVKQHGGIITVKSELGKGSQFDIFLPIPEEKVEATSKKESRGVIKGVGKILVVDDEEPIREALNETLSSAGYCVFCCCNGREAVEYYEKNYTTISVVVLDLIMPEMNGIDCYHKLKEIYNSVKVVVMSGYGRGEEIHQILEKGASAIVEKPFDIDKISKVISEIIAK